MGIFKKKKKKEEKISNEPVEMDSKTMRFYAIVFCIILFIALIFKVVDLFNKDNEIPTNEEISSIKEEPKSTIDSILNVLENNNYDMSLTITADTDILNVIIRRETADKELIYKTYRDNNNIYYRNKESIYEMFEGSNKKIENVSLYNEYDETFINTNNIIKLVENKTYELNLSEEEYDIKRYKTEISKVINIYNEYNNKEIEKKVSGEVILDVNHVNRTLHSIKLDLTVLYKNLNYDYAKVIYEYEFDNFNKINISSLFTLPDAQ